jgi:hypothetical protein
MVSVIKVPSLYRAVHRDTAVVILGGVMVIMLAMGPKVCGFEPANLELVLFINEIIQFLAQGRLFFPQIYKYLQDFKCHFGVQQ